MIWPVRVSYALEDCRDGKRRDLSGDAIGRLLDVARDHEDHAPIVAWLQSEAGAALRDRWIGELHRATAKATDVIGGRLTALLMHPEGEVWEPDIAPLHEVFSTLEKVVSEVLAWPVIRNDYAERARAKMREWEDEVTKAIMEEGESECSPGEDYVVLYLRILASWTDSDLSQAWRSPGAQNPPYYLTAAAFSLWETRWREEASKLFRKPAALVVPVHSAIGVAIRNLPRRRVEDPRQLPIPGLLPAIPEGAQALRDALAAACEVSPVLAHRTVRSFVRWGAMAHTLGEGSEIVVFRDDKHELVAYRTASGVEIAAKTGGLDFLARAVGHTTKKNPIAAILSVFGTHGTTWQTPSSQGCAPLLSWSEEGRGKVAIHLSPLLLPGVAGRKNDPLTSSDNVLVPTLPLPDLSPFSGRASERLPDLDWLALEHFTRHRAQLADGVPMDWRALGDSAGISKRSSTVEQAVNRWVTTPDDPHRPGARWVLVDGEPMNGRFVLVPHGEEGAAMDFLADGADRAKTGRARGQKRASKASSRK